MGNKSTKNAKTQNKNAQPYTPPAATTSSLSARRQKMKKESVFDEDHRQPVDQNHPIQFIGLIRAKFKSQPATTIGTGAIVGEDLVLTAAHNLCRFNKNQKKYKEHLQSTLTSSFSLASTVETTKSLSVEETINVFKHVEFAEWIEFYPAINGEIKGLASMEAMFRQNREGNYFKVKQFKVHPGYITQANNKRFDICLIQLETPLKNQPIKILENYTNINTEISVYGYPQNFKEEQGLIKARQLGAKGRFNLDNQNGYLKYKIATQGGQSGSPIFINTLKNGKQEHFCIGIHNGGNPELLTNIGIHLTEEKLKFIIESEESLTGKLSKIATAKLPELPPSNIPSKPRKDVNQKSLDDLQVLIINGEEKCKKGEMPKSMIYLYREAALASLSHQIYQKAIRYYQRFISLIEQLSQSSRNQDDEEEYQIALINLAKSYCECGNYDKSLSLYEKAQAKCKEVFSLSVQKQSVILNNKGAVLVHLNRYEEALDYFALSYRLRKNKFGEENLMTYNSLENVASMKFKLGTGLSECISDYERVLKFKEKKFGNGSREALFTKANLAFALFQTKQYPQSLDYLYYCIEKMKQLTVEANNAQYNDFIKQFRSRMRELCRSQCSLENLKVAFQICQKYEFTDLAKELDGEWSKRRAAQAE